MKRFRFKSIYAMVCAATLLLGGCGAGTPAVDETQETNPANETQSTAEITQAPTPVPTEAPLEIVDYAGTLELNMASNSKKMEVTVKTYVDGDTTHFYVPEDFDISGVLKARYLGVNTPESTGKIEEYGKTASNFTKEKLSNAVSIIVESDDENWNVDSTGDRNLVWVWYKTAESETYRNLNIELLQNGLAIANSSAQNRYGSTCMSAIAQAKAQKLNVYSGQKDPNFYYGDAIELTLKELRLNAEQYNGMKVAFNGIITMNTGAQGVYVEEYDAETDMYYGMFIYYGHGLSGEGLDILTVGNEARIVGTVQFYETGGTYQVAGLTYRMMKPNDPGNIQKLSSGHNPAYVLTTAEDFVYGTVTVQGTEEEVTRPYAEMAMATSVSMENLKVVDVYTTTNEDSSSYGALTLTCEDWNGVRVSVRTAVLLDENNNIITEDAYLGKTIDVKGVVDYFDGTYQIKVFSAKNITVK